MALTLASISDRLIRHADRLTARALAEATRDTGPTRSRRAYYAGATGQLLREWPGIPAATARHAGVQIAIAAPVTTRERLSTLLFGQQAIDWTSLPSVPAWRVHRWQRAMLAQGADLAVCETSHLNRAFFAGPRSFVIPSSIDHVLLIRGPMDALLAGRRMKDVRLKVKRAEREGYTFRVSHDPADYAYFYERMYAPHMRARFGPEALVADRDGYLWRAFERGGVLLVLSNETPVGGAVCFLSGRSFTASEKGILDGDRQLLRYGVSHLVDWYCWNWAAALGALSIEMGRTRPFFADGVFIAKTDWGSVLADAKYLYTDMHFALGRHPSEALIQRLNEIGWIGRFEGHYCRAWINSAPDGAAATIPPSMVAEAGSRALYGIAEISARGTRLHAAGAEPT